MSKLNILLSITNGIWLIEEHAAIQYGAHVAAALNGERVFGEDKPVELSVSIVEPTGGAFMSSNLNGVKPGSVAVLDINGPIMKEDNCGDPGTKSIGQMLQQLSANPNISGVVMVIDSPGGTVAGTQALANIIKSFDKPIVTHAEDLMASAAYWLGSSADYVIANTGTTRIGSIGTMLTFADMQPMWENMGVKFHEIFATKSTAKNADFLEARKGNYENIIKSTLDPLNNEFLNAVKANRGDKLNQAKTLDGSVYVAADALAYGLIDAIGTLDDAIAKVRELAGITASETVISQQTNMKKVTLTAAHAALLAVCGVSLAAGQDSVEVDVDALNAAVAKQSSDLATANTEAGTAKEKITAAEDRATKAEKDLADLKAASAGATTTSTEKVDDINTEATEDYSSDIDAELAAKRKALGY